MDRFWFLFLSVSFLQVASATNTGFPYNWTYNATKIDPSTLKLIWSDEFDDPSVITPASGGTGPWYAPGHADYGMAHFPTPPSSAYNISQSILTQSTLNSTGQWLGACMQTMNSQGKGFACQNCYFEARARMNGGHGSWGAFWLHSMDYPMNNSTLHSEIDVLEYYGPSDGYGHHHTAHIWNSTNGTQHDYYNSDYTKVVELDLDYHLHGAWLTDEWIIIYLDRVELARIQRPVQNQVPHYIIISVTMNSNDPPYVPSNMTFDYVRVYQNLSISTPSSSSSSSPSITLALVCMALSYVRWG